MMTFSFGVEGVLDGHPVQMTRFCGKGAHITTTSPFLPSLDLGLGLGRAGVLSTLTELLGAHEIEVGDPEFDATYAVRGDEPERVRALLTPAVRAELRTLRTNEIKLTDAWFSSDLSASVESVPELERAVREAVRIARVIEAASGAVPPASVLRPHYDAWMAFARERPMRVSATPLWLEGRVGRTLVGARAARKSATEIVFELSVGVEQSFGVGLSVRPRRTAFQKVLEMIDTPVPTGDEAFDAQFETRTPAPEQARHLLDASTRRGLLDLAPLGAVFFDDRGVALHASAASLEPSRFGAVIEAMRAIVEARFVSPAAYR